jgi:signal transduction histidine kinase/ActR/RegA family two-component response regulator
VRRIYNAQLVSIGSRLLLLVVAVLLPAGLAAVWGLAHAYRSQQEAAHQSLREMARALGAVVEQDLAERKSMLDTLAKSPALREGRVRELYEYARSIAPTVERTIILFSPEGRQLFNTRLPLDAPLPFSGMLPRLREERGVPPDQPIVSDLYYAPVGRAQSFAVQVPVIIEGAVRHYLAVGSYSSTLQKLIDGQDLRADWNTSILDRNGIVVARRLRPEQFVGKPATQDMAAHLRQAPEGLFETVRLDGVATYTAYAPIGNTGWTFAVSMPKAHLTAPFTRAAILAGCVTFGLLSLGLALALLVSRGIARPLRDLVHSAAVVGRGETPPPWRHRLQESRLIAAQLGKASAQIQEARRTLEERVERAVSESRRAQEALAQASKLEALGRLTRGIAHDFNNVLQTISIGIEMAWRESPHGPVREVMESARRAVQTAVKLTRQLTTFGRGHAPEPATLDVRDQVLGLQDLVARALRADIRMDLDFPAELWPVSVDAVQLELALLNAAINARDAMPRGGSFTVRARNVRVGEGEAPGMPAGEYVRLDLADTGVGMAPEMLARVFEPFFTTKSPGKGVGLGLAQIWGFARQSGGMATIDSTPGSGTTLTLWLPRAAGTPAAAQAVQPEGSEPAAPPLRVLLVEDDPLVLGVVKPSLEGAGFRVRTAVDADAALAAVEKEVPDAVFSDVVMPGTRNGVDLAREVARRHPRVAILLATGYAEIDGAAVPARVLPKPYRLADVKAALLSEWRSKQAAPAG